MKLKRFGGGPLLVGGLGPPPQIPKFPDYMTFVAATTSGISVEDDICKKIKYRKGVVAKLL